jgi:hypothetical protein
MMMHAGFAYADSIAQILEAHPVNPAPLHKVLSDVQNPFPRVVHPLAHEDNLPSDR